MSQTFCALGGKVVDVVELEIEGARDTARLLKNGRLWFSFVECRRVEADDNTTGHMEIVVFDVEPEVPPHCVHEICSIERVAAVFSDGHIPDTLALRTDFPLVPHINPRNEEFPRSLCLWEETPVEVQLQWTTAAYLERIREWLRLTARGELHAPDQALEQLLPALPWRFVAPESLLCGAEDTVRNFVIRRLTEGDQHTLIAQRRLPPERDPDTGKDVPFVAIVVHGQSQTHGVIRHLPFNLKQLHDFASAAQLDLLAHLRDRLKELKSEGVLLQARLVIVLVLPKTRVEGGSPESYERWAFAISTPMLNIGEAIGAWVVNDGFPGTLLVPDESQQGEGIEMMPMNVVPMLSRQTAALFNGLDDSNEVRVTAIGAGALGSQSFFNLARAGFGNWTVIDKDIFLPHNGARHALSGMVIGYAKAPATVEFMNSLFDGTFEARSIVADIMSPGEKKAQVESALNEAEVVLDFSASVPVARYLSHDSDASARRISVFLNPRGSDLVILAEDSARSISLADLEMQLYRTVITDVKWRDHLQSSGEKIRYARSCGDMSGRIPQDYIAPHAATTSRALRRLITSGEASITLWRLNSESDEQVRLALVPEPVVEVKCGAWTIRTDQGLIRKIHEMRADRLPVETGGVLVGAFDTGRKIVYIVHALPAPSDSEERLDSFVRGYVDLKDNIDKIQGVTANQLGYAGEWHSHPRGHDCQPSRKDFKLFNVLATHRLGDGLPPVMLIAGDNDGCAWFVDTMPEPPENVQVIYVVVR